MELERKQISERGRIIVKNGNIGKQKQKDNENMKTARKKIRKIVTKIEGGGEEKCEVGLKTLQREEKNKRKKRRKGGGEVVAGMKKK